MFEMQERDHDVLRKGKSLRAQSHVLVWDKSNVPRHDPDDTHSKKIVYIYGTGPQGYTD